MIIHLAELIRARHRNRLDIARADPPLEIVRAPLRLEVPE